MCKPLSTDLSAAQVAEQLAKFPGAITGVKRGRDENLKLLADNTPELKLFGGARYPYLAKDLPATQQPLNSFLQMLAAYQGLYGYPSSNPYLTGMAPSYSNGFNTVKHPYVFAPNVYSNPQGNPGSNNPICDNAFFPPVEIDKLQPNIKEEKTIKKTTKTKKKRRVCEVEDCTKFAQGTTLRCVRHGGGNRCASKGCTKSAAGTTPFCISHGGGKRCHSPNCPKSAIPPHNFCFAHGGGRRCLVQSCTKGARGTTNYCIGHGGGRRCQVKGCGKSDQGRGFCIAHGGGRKKRKTSA